MHVVLQRGCGVYETKSRCSWVLLAQPNVRRSTLGFAITPYFQLLVLLGLVWTQLFQLQVPLGLARTQVVSAPRTLGTEYSTMTGARELTTESQLPVLVLWRPLKACSLASCMREKGMPRRLCSTGPPTTDT